MARKNAARSRKSKKSKTVRSKKTSAEALLSRPRELSAPRAQGQDTPVVGIGASAGGLEAIEAFFRAMPAGSGLAFVLVTHLAPEQVSLLPGLVQKCTEMPVHQITDGTRVQTGTVHVIPPGRGLVLTGNALKLTKIPSGSGRHMPIDRFFRSLACARGPRAVGIVLSGTGSDGTLGLRALKGELGMVMVQDEASAKYGGMPASAVGTGLADFVLPPGKMPETLVRYFDHAREGEGRRVVADPGRTPGFLQKIFALLRARTQHDFSLYKRNTICRRIERRMSLHQIDDVGRYYRFLKDSEAEVGALFKELLIGVTNFFRDPDCYRVLAKNVLPKLLRDKPEGYPLRVWVPGCATGEEAYSLAILLHEAVQAAKSRVNAQIFATDIDPDAVELARAGLYPGSIEADVTPARLKRYFLKDKAGGYRVGKLIREMLVFAQQDIIKDPPFTKLDLLSCRNLLIYFDGALQKKLLPVFHYSLRQGGFLLLGPSETVGPSSHLFAPVDKKWKIYARRPIVDASRPVVEFPSGLAHLGEDGSAAFPKGPLTQDQDVAKLVETILEQSEAPPCVIIDKDLNIIYFHGRTGRFLEPAAGRASLNLLQMIRQSLRVELAAMISKVSASGREEVRRGLAVEHAGETLRVDLSVKSVSGGGAASRLLMVVFETRRPRRGRRRERRSSRSVEEVEAELRDTRESLQTTIEEFETSNEELKSTNEELQSTNEELQSSNEELETSKEELQSLNEESTTVNAELQARIDELAKAHDDMRNLLDSTDVATLFLDAELRVRRFTPRVTDILPLVSTDVGRPIDNIATHVEGLSLAEAAGKVLADLAVIEREVSTRRGCWLIMRARPYRTTNNVIDGVVISFLDVTDKEEAGRLLKGRENALRSLVEGRGKRQRLTVVDQEGVIQYTNRPSSGMTNVEMIGTSVFHGQVSRVRTELRLAITNAFSKGEQARVELRLDEKAGAGMRHVSIVEPLWREGKVAAVLVQTTEVSRDEPGGGGDAED